MHFKKYINSATLHLTPAILRITSAILRITSAILRITSATLRITSAILRITSATLRITSAIPSAQSAQSASKFWKCIKILKEGRPEMGNPKVWLTYGRTDLLTWVGARDTCVSKKTLKHFIWNNKLPICFEVFKMCWATIYLNKLSSTFLSNNWTEPMFQNPKTFAT